MFRLNPSKRVNQAFLYLLGFCAQRYGIDLFALTMMSNHYHLVARDNDALYPNFLRDFNALRARCINAAFGDADTFWSGSQPSLVRLGDAESVLERIVYTLTNPVKHPLVSRAIAWPGVTSLSAMLDDRPITVARPAWFFADKEINDRMPLPETVTLRFVRPPGFEHLTHAQWRDLLLSKIRDVEAAAEQARRGKGGVIGVAAIRKQRRHASPTSVHKLGGLNPRVAAADKWRRIERIQSNRRFVQMHAEARIACQQGRLATFPAGTWAAHRHYRAPVAQVDLTEPGCAPIPRTGPCATAPPGS